MMPGERSLTDTLPDKNATGRNESLEWPEYWPESAGEYEHLVDCLLQPLVRYAFQRVRSLPDAEDIVQEVLFKAFTLRSRNRGKKGVVAYLYRMTANACTDHYRRARMIRGKIIRKAGTLALIEGTGRLEQEVIAELERIELMLASLPRRQAEIIRLRVVDELNFAQIAKALDVKLPTVKSRFKYGIEKLRRKLSAFEGGA
jgi:RNA polymerase sigma-70 factor (ECF subfamily)